MSARGLVVLDRHWPSEAIYGPIFRGCSQYSPNERSIERVLLKHAALYVMVLPNDLDELVRRFEELKRTRREDFPEVAEVARRYADLWHGNVVSASLEGTYTDQLAKLGGVSKLAHWFRYDFTKASVEEQADAMVHKLQVLRRLQIPEALDPLQGNLTGHIHLAKYLFVGDKPGDLSSRIRWPFYARNRSSEFLNSSLHKIGFPEHKAMFTNINDPDHDDFFWKIFQQKPDIKVICLGNDAQKGILHKYGTWFQRKVYHPSYARRFMHYGNYPDLLWEIIND